MHVQNFICRTCCIAGGKRSKFVDVLQQSICRQQRLHAWCDHCSKFKPTVSESIHCSSASGIRTQWSMARSGTPTTPRGRGQYSFFLCCKYHPRLIACVSVMFECPWMLTLGHLALPNHDYHCGSCRPSMSANTCIYILVQELTHNGHFLSLSLYRLSKSHSAIFPKCSPSTVRLRVRQTASSGSLRSSCTLASRPKALQGGSL